VYDPFTQVWTYTGSLTYGRYGHTATLLSGGKVLVVGGGGAAGFLNTAELYDPATGQWSMTSSLFYGRYRHSATRLADGKVLVTGGLIQPSLRSLDTTEIYDPTSQNWSAAGKLNEARMGHTVTLVPDGEVLVVGGLSFGLQQPPVLRSTELFNPATLVWSLAGNLATPRVSHSETNLPTSPLETAVHPIKVLVAGGDYDDASCELYVRGDRVPPVAR
jgi:N-acetylneuraminic acid mutarotase